MLQQQAQDAYFDYDKSDIRPDARDALTHDAGLLKQIFTQDPNFTVIVEGHCDERGSAEYNLALGDRRATAAKEFLVQLGIPADRMKTISYGKPVTTAGESLARLRTTTLADELRAQLSPAARIIGFSLKARSARDRSTK